MKKVFVFLLFALAPLGVVLGAAQVDINTASLQELDQLAGIGPVYAQRIIDGRPYSSLDDLDRVKGIGPATLQKIKEQGMACVGCGAASPQDSVIEAIPTAEIASSPRQGETPRNDEEITYPSGVVINELLPSPQGADESEEWIEIYNTNNFEVDLSGWKIQDQSGTNFAISGKILGQGFFVLGRPQTKIVLNESDQITLLQPDGKIADSVIYAKAPTAQSYNKQDSGWAWSQTLTPGAKNSIYVQKTPPSTISRPSGLPKLEKSATNDTENSLAALSQNQELKTENPWFLFFTACAIAIFSSAAVFLANLKIKNYKIKNSIPCQDTAMPKP